MAQVYEISQGTEITADFTASATNEIDLPATLVRQHDGELVPVFLAGPAERLEVLNARAKAGRIALSTEPSNRQWTVGSSRYAGRLNRVN